MRRLGKFLASNWALESDANCLDQSRTALPREMHVGLPSTTLPDPEERSSTPDIVTDYRMHDQNRLTFLRNKPPRWNSGELREIGDESDQKADERRQKERNRIV